MGILLSLSLIVTGSLSAQDKQALPDSIPVDATVTTSADTLGSVGTKTDSTEVSSGFSTDTTTETQEPDSVILRTVPDHTTSKYKSDRDFEYANDPRYWRAEEPARQTAFGRFLIRLFSSVWFRGFIYCLLGGVLIFAIYKIVIGNRLHLFYKSSASTPTGGLPEEQADIYQEGLDAKITAAIAAQDFRMAIRYLFLKTLRVLNDKELIRYHADSTNQQYADQLKGHPPEKDFRFLVYVYEHVWYGERQLTKESFERIVTGFEDFYHLIA